MPQIKDCTSDFYPGLCGVNVIVDPQTIATQKNDRVIIIGQKMNDGDAEPGLNKVVDSKRAKMFGANSMLNKQIEEFLAHSPQADLWAYVLPNKGTAGKATVNFSIEIIGNSQETFYLWVNGITYQADLDTSTETIKDLIQKFATMINANDPTLIATSTSPSEGGLVLTIETKNKGAIGGFLDVRKAYGRTPEKVCAYHKSIHISTQEATGTPHLYKFAHLSEGFEFVINPYPDKDSINSVSKYLCKQWNGGANSRAYGVIYSDAYLATNFSNHTNNALMSYLAVYRPLTPSFIESSNYGAIAYNTLNSLSKEMFTSLNGKVMKGMLAPEVADVFSDQEKAMLLREGLGYFDVNRNNVVSIGRAITTYTRAEDGERDLSLQEVNKVAMIAYLNKYFREKINKKYKGFAFRRDGIVGNNARKVATISAIRNYVLQLGQELSNENIIQDMNGFIASASVTLNENGCIEVVLSPEIVDQFCCMNITLRTI